MKTKKTKKVVKTKEEIQVLGFHQPPSEESLCTITLTLGDTTIQGTGKTVLEAIKSMPVPVKITTKGIINAQQGERKAELVWIIPRVKRLFFPLAQPLIAKQLDYLMQ